MPINTTMMGLEKFQRCVITKLVEFLKLPYLLSSVSEGGGGQVQSDEAIRAS